MRYLSIIQNGQRRVAVEDIEIGGETIKAGEGIILDIAPENWDASTFPSRQAGSGSRERRSAARLRLRPAPVRRPATGPCRMQIVFPTLLRRIPTLRLAIPFDEVPFKHDTLAYGVYSLPCSGDLTRAAPKVGLFAGSLAKRVQKVTFGARRR